MIKLKIVITGGPGAGKTSALEYINKYFTDKGLAVVIVSETATEIISSGITPLNIGQKAFQKNLLLLQLAKEKYYTEMARHLKNDSIMIFDRGALDGKAYLSAEQFEEILEETGLSEESLISSYNALFYLESPAGKNSQFYTTENNPARSESPDEASELAEKTLSVWQSNKKLIKIENQNKFEDKMKHLIVKIEQLI